MDQNVIYLSYLVAAVLFIFGLKRLSSPATARSGNMLGATGMLVAIVVTLLDQEVLNYIHIAGGMVVGAAIGAVMARSIKMTAMPQMVAVFNGLGGGASALVASGEFSKLAAESGSMDVDVSITIMLGTFIGALTFSGSLIAFGKLQDLGHITGREISDNQGPQPRHVPVDTGHVGVYLVVVFSQGSAVLSEVSPVFIALVVVSLLLGVCCW